MKGLNKMLCLVDGEHYLPKDLPAMQGTWVRCLDGKIPWRRKQQPPPMFLPGKILGQRKRVRHDKATQQQLYSQPSHVEKHKKAC